MLYPWLKAFHLVAVVSWFAALFYLPRLFVYHAMTEDEISIERFKVMERKLYRGIANPAMMATIALGVALVIHPMGRALIGIGWFQAKMVLVVALLAYHFMCKAHLKKFADNANTKSHVYFRWFNEFPVLVLIGIAILVIVKPF